MNDLIMPISVTSASIGVLHPVLGETPYEMTLVEFLMLEIMVKFGSN